VGPSMTAADEKAQQARSMEDKIAEADAKVMAALGLTEDDV